MNAINQADFARANRADPEGFSAAALKRADYTYDQLPGAVTAAELKAEAAFKAAMEAKRWTVNPGVGFSRKYAAEMARKATLRAQRFNNELAEMLAVIANEMAEREEAA